MRSMLWEKGRTPRGLREKQLEDRETEMEYSLSWIEEERETENEGGVSRRVRKRSGMRRAGSQHGAESKATRNKVR